MENVRSNMFLFIYAVIIFNFSFTYSISFMDFTTKVDKGNWIIHASLTDQESGKVWQIVEKISSDERLEGKIDIHAKDSATVFYSFTTSYDNDKRLVMHDNECDIYSYKVDWDKMLPGVTKPLTNMVLLLGPSFIFRLANMEWTPNADTVIRGALMHSATTIFGEKLNVTVYYKTPNDVKIGVKQPNRIVLTGYDPNKIVETNIGETLILDIYLLSITFEQLSESVQPTPGIGCPIYLRPHVAPPDVQSPRVHFLAKDTVNGKQTSLREAHADEDSQVLSLYEINQEYDAKSIYDYNLGVYYILGTDKDDCRTRPIDQKSPGINSKLEFSIASLLFIEDSLKYLGRVIFEHRAGFKAEVWESVRRDVSIDSGKYDKVVTTIYLHPAAKGSVLKGYYIVAASRNAYRKNQSSGKMELIESLHRDFYDFDVDLPDAEYQSAFALGDCFTDPSKRLTLTFHLICDLVERSNCIRVGGQLSTDLRTALLNKIDQTYALSPLRIVDIEFVFNNDLIEADVTFIEAPKAIESFAYRKENIDIQKIKKSHQTGIRTPEECLKYHASYYTKERAVVHCEKDNICLSTNDPSTIQKSSSSGYYCSVFEVPLMNLNRFGKEKTLEEIHDHLLRRMFNTNLHIKEEFIGTYYTYTINDVVASNKRNEEKVKRIFEVASYSHKLIPDGNNIVEVANIKRFSDCYRACAKSEDILCETFTFCENQEHPICYVSSYSISAIVNNLISDETCMTYTKNHLSDYTRHRNKAYKAPLTTSIQLYIDECANECSTNPDCFSFQSCDTQCTLGGYYTEGSVKNQPGCSVFSPKLSQRYQLTGTKIVTEVLHTELDLDVDQCAAFCFDYQRGETDICKSFNYCPKGESSATCQLTKYSVSDSKTNTSESKLCHNYELSKKRYQENKETTNTRSTVHTSGSRAFGIIVLFLVGGIIVGFVGPYAAMKIKSSSAFVRKSTDNFTWKRQVDETEEEHDEIQI